MKWLSFILLKRLSLGKRFAALLAVTTLVPLLLTATGIYLINSFLKDAEINYSISKGHASGSQFVRTTEAYFRHANLYLLESALKLNPTLDRLEGEMATMDEAASVLSGELAAAHDPKFRSLGAEFEEKWGQVQQHLQAYFNDLSAGLSPADLRNNLETLTPEIENLKQMVDEIDDQLSGVSYAKYKQTYRTREVLAVATIFILLAMGLIVLFNFQLLYRGVLSTLKDLTSSLQASARQLSQESAGVNRNSDTLARASSEQASSLQETVAAIDEISAMVDRNAEGANKSSLVSAKSEANAEQGREIVNQMIESIDHISTSTDEIAAEIEASNKEIGNIVTLISEIGEKTQVINDIVFQTKLLSFNASVEAARAGEHGRGFAIVAEEVGNLAAVSGTAANEISSMLSKSIQQVHTIINSSRERIERMLKASKQKVENGTQTAALCGTALEEIRHEVTQVNQMVKEIATASQEQSRGVQEITKAMTRLDQITQENAALATNSSSTAEELSLQAEYITEIINNLVGLIRGEGKASTISDDPVDWDRGATSVADSHEGNRGKVIEFSQPADADKKKNRLASY